MKCLPWFLRRLFNSSNLHFSLSLLMISCHNLHFPKMNNVTENNEEKSIEVFTGTDWECGLVQSLLENAEINAFVYYGGRGTLAPWNLVGSVPKK